MKLSQITLCTIYFFHKNNIAPSIFRLKICLIMCTFEYMYMYHGKMVVSILYHVLHVVVHCMYKPFSVRLCITKGTCTYLNPVHKLLHRQIISISGGVIWSKNPEKWLPGLGILLVERTKPPEPPGCLIFDSPHPHKQEASGLDHNYRLLVSFLGGYFSSFKKILMHL